jgi:hypothetical protein
MHLSAHQSQLKSRPASDLNRGVVMKVPVKIERLPGKQDKSPFSAVTCPALLSPAGILVKFAAWIPIFHVAYRN